MSQRDWPRVSKLRWSYKGNGYVRAYFKKAAGGSGQFVLLHRFVMSAPSGYVVDHIDRDPLNNTRENLQIITPARNSMRSTTARNGGVSFDRRRGKWRVRIRFEGHQIDLGSYTTEEQARVAAAEGRRALWDNGATNPERAIF